MHACTNMYTYAHMHIHTTRQGPSSCLRLRQYLKAYSMPNGTPTCAIQLLIYFCMYLYTRMSMYYAHNTIYRLSANSGFQIVPDRTYVDPVSHNNNSVKFYFIFLSFNTYFILYVDSESLLRDFMYRVGI
jgi:hypothetical protein